MTGLCPPSCQRYWMDSTAQSLPTGRRARGRPIPWRAATEILWMGRTSLRWLVSTTSMLLGHVHPAARCLVLCPAVTGRVWQVSCCSHQVLCSTVTLSSVD